MHACVCVAGRQTAGLGVGGLWPALVPFPAAVGFTASTTGTFAADESLEYVHFMCPYENEDKLPALFHHLKVRALLSDGRDVAPWRRRRVGDVVDPRAAGPLQGPARRSPPSSHPHPQIHRLELGVADIQLRLTPLEDVFLTITKKAELEHAQVRRAAGNGRLPAWHWLSGALEEGTTHTRTGRRRGRWLPVSGAQGPPSMPAKQ